MVPQLMTRVSQPPRTGVLPPVPDQDRGTSPARTGVPPGQDMGNPQPGLGYPQSGQGYLPPPGRLCCEGGMPLAFTQDGFLDFIRKTKFREQKPKFYDDMLRKKGKR